MFSQVSVILCGGWGWGQVRSLGSYLVMHYWLIVLGDGDYRSTVNKDGCLELPGGSSAVELIPPA